MQELSHINLEGRAFMVDVGGKEDTERVAKAEARVYMSPSTLKRIKTGGIKKGDVLSVAQVAGIMAAKKTHEIIPMCHPLLLTSVDLGFSYHEEESYLLIEAVVKCTGKTGVEMEALVAVTAAALTVYDMCKSVDRWMSIEGVRLMEKAGGKSGHLSRNEEQKYGKIGGMGMRGKVLAVCTSAEKGEVKRDVGEAVFVVNHGIEGDAHAGPWHRQVSLLSISSIEKMRAKGADVGYGDFAENLTIEGIEVYQLPVGTRLRVGDEVELEVTQIGKKCHSGCAIMQQVGDCVMPREGIFARVVRGGKVKRGDVVEIIGATGGIIME